MCVRPSLQRILIACGRCRGVVGHIVISRRRVSHLRVDSLGQLLNRANVHAGCKVLVSETCGGLVTGGIAQRLGGELTDSAHRP